MDIALYYTECGESPPGAASQERGIPSLFRRTNGIFFRLPILVIAGTRDSIRAAHNRLIAESPPNGELVWIPGNHFIAAKNPEPFNAAVDEFLRRA